MDPGARDRARRGIRRRRFAAHGARRRDRSRGRRAASGLPGPGDARRACVVDGGIGPRLGRVGAVTTNPSGRAAGPARLLASTEKGSARMDEVPQESRRSRLMFEGRLVAIYTPAEAGKPMEAHDDVGAIAGVGLDGDRYATAVGAHSQTPGSGRQVTLVE